MRTETEGVERWQEVSSIQYNVYSMAAVFYLISCQESTSRTVNASCFSRKRRDRIEYPCCWWETSQLSCFVVLLLFIKNKRFTRVWKWESQDKDEIAFLVQLSLRLVCWEKCVCLTHDIVCCHTSSDWEESCSWRHNSSRWVRQRVDFETSEQL